MYTHLPQKKETVFVGLSGGVDSSVTAKRLIDAGKNVVGVFIKTWQPDFLVCNWEAERLDAMRVSAHLGIPFLTCDAVETYRDGVAMYMIEEYKRGRTPNPDVMCNQHVKFGTFLDFALNHGADKIATGHYARVHEENGVYHLLRGRDHNKDQSYFLWTLTQEQLSHTYFPIGDSQKYVVREEAQKAGLMTYAKKDSQGICFLGEVDIKEFLSHYVTVEKGDVLDESGNIIGHHDGALYYTLGQRHGFIIKTKNIASSPQYVISKDLTRNTLTVSHTPRTVHSKRITLTNGNIAIHTTHTQCEAQFRYRQKPFLVTFEKQNNTTASLTLHDTEIEMPSNGQSCVLYDGEQCLGGGIIETIYENN